MVEFQKSSLSTTAVASNERATALVPTPHRTPDRSRNMTSTGIDRHGSPWPLYVRDLPSLKIVQEERQCAIEYRRRIAIRQDVTHEILNLSQLVVRFAANRDLEFVPLRGEWNDHRA